MPYLKQYLINATDIRDTGQISFMHYHGKGDVEALHDRLIGNENHAQAVVALFHVLC